MFGFIFGAVIYGFCGLLFIVLGIRNIKSKKPVTLNTSIKPYREDELRDVSEWNKKHGIVYIFFGATMIVSYAVTYFFQESYLGLLIIVLPIFVFIPIIYIVHNHLKKKLVIEKKV